ncbi:MAG: hypothetical protein J6S92_03465, partial [Oscillospiraceae bacterium]|nr:hypothetical protein [Oscillospiraceae bacterium]
MMKRNQLKRLLAFCGSLMMLSAVTAGLPAFAETDPAEETVTAAEAETPEDSAEDAAVDSEEA